jgi:hypothetical protein
MLAASSAVDASKRASIAMSSKSPLRLSMDNVYNVETHPTLPIIMPVSMASALARVGKRGLPNQTAGAKGAASSGGPPVQSLICCLGKDHMLSRPDLPSGGCPSTKRVRQINWYFDLTAVRNGNVHMSLRPQEEPPCRSPDLAMVHRGCQTLRNTSSGPKSRTSPNLDFPHG